MNVPTPILHARTRLYNVIQRPSPDLPRLWAHIRKESQVGDVAVEDAAAVVIDAGAQVHGLVEHRGVASRQLQHWSAVWNKDQPRGQSLMAACVSMRPWLGSRGTSATVQIPCKNDLATDSHHRPAKCRRSGRPRWRRCPQRLRPGRGCSPALRPDCPA